MLKKALILATISFSISSCIGGNDNNVGNSNNSQIAGITTAPLSDIKPIQPYPDSDPDIPEQNNINNYEIKAQIGYSADTRTGIIFKNRCIANTDNPDYINYSNPQGTVQFGASASSNQVANLLNVNDYQTNGDFDKFTSSGQSNYVRDIEDKRDTLNFNYYQVAGMEASFQPRVFGNDLLTPYAYDLLISDTDKFIKTCGDSFVISALQGGVLALNVSIHFQNNTQKHSFLSTSSNDLGIGFLISRLKKENDAALKNTSISVNAYQMGGNPEKLAQLFGNQQYHKYNNINCRINDISNCERIINEIIGYAKNEFGPSIDFKKPETLYTYQYNIKSYSSLGLNDVSLPELTEEEKTANKYLSNSIAKDREMFNYLKTYKRQPFYNTFADNSTKDLVNKAIESYISLLGEYNNYNIIDACYTDILHLNTKCVEMANQIKNMRSKYESAIDIANKLATVAAGITPLGVIYFVPINTDQNTSSDISKGISGKFVSYFSNSESFTTTCELDTTSDNSYFKKYFPQFINKSVYCGGQIIPGINNFYVNTIEDRKNFGNAGHIVNKVETSYPIPPYGYNVQFFYSDGTDFTFNPI